MTNKLSDEMLDKVIGGFKPEFLTEEEVAQWKDLIENVNQIEAGQIAGVSTQTDVTFANEQLEAFIRKMIKKYNM